MRKLCSTSCKTNSLIGAPHSTSLSLTNEGLAPLTRAKEEMKALGKSKPRGYTRTYLCLSCALSHACTLEMSPQCQQLQLMAFPRNSKQHWEHLRTFVHLCVRTIYRDESKGGWRDKLNKQNDSLILTFFGKILHRQYCWFYEGQPTYMWQHVCVQHAGFA